MLSSSHGHAIDFLDRNRCWVSRKDKDLGGVTLTHTFLDSRKTGKVFVPPALAEGFYDAIALDVQHNRLPPLNELKVNSVFHMFADLDIRADAAEKLPDAVDVGRVCVRVARRFLPEWDALRLIVLCAPDKTTDDGARHKRGMHLHFPGLRVQMNEALYMREATVDALSKAFPDIDWPEDFDNSPFVNPSGGLRVVGAPKASACDACDNERERKRGCQSCGGTGKMESRPPQRYTFRTCLDGEGNVDEGRCGVLTTNFGALVRACSVRSIAQTVTPEWRRFEGCPSFSAIQYNKYSAPTAGSKKRAFGDDKTSMRSWPQTTVVEKDKIDRLTKIFRTRFRSPDGTNVYAQVDLYPIRFSSRNNTYYCQFRGQGESYCFNKGTDHSKNRVYGIVTRTAAYVRCHSATGPEGRLSGKPCREFRSKEEYLSPGEQACLFPSGATLAKSVFTASALKKPRTDSLFQSPDAYLQAISDQLMLHKKT